MSVTLDVNILLYASSEDPEHEPARALVAELARGPGLLYLFWPTIMGYLRMVTHPRIQDRPLTPVEAKDNISQLLIRPHVRTPSETEGFWELYSTTAGDHTRSNDVSDAHLVTLMHQHGVGIIYTRDRGFRRFESIEVRDPFQ